MTTILGINAYHGDASAALVIDGKLVAAVEEERFNRIKHWAGFPAKSIQWCLSKGELSLETSIMLQYPLILEQTLVKGLLMY